MPSYAPIFELTRGQVVESIHFGALAVVSADGRLLAWHGDPDVVTYLRSSSKPFQALPLIENGGADFYHLTPKEIALICASHAGTDEHLETVQGIQAKTGVQQQDLLCGVHPISHKPTAEAMRARGELPTPNRHNCSGKHTGMVAYARMKGFPVEDYINPDHPIQQEIWHTVADMFDLPAGQVHIGIDGCSAPNFAAPLRNAALAFARLCDPSYLSSPRAEACQLIARSMLAFPEMVGGPDSFDTRLMRLAQGRVLCKGGAEGYLAMGLPPGVLSPESPGVGITLKISDGDLAGHSRPSGDSYGHARPAVALEVLRQLGVLSAEALHGLAEYGPSFVMHNWRKLLIGEAHPCFELTRSAWPGRLAEA